MSEKTYSVQANNLAGFSFGDVVNAEDLPNANFEALVASGHLSLVEIPAIPATDEADEEAD